METEKIRPVVGNDRPFLIGPRGVWSKPWVCGKRLQRTAWKPLADSVGALSITYATCSVTCNVAYLTWPLMPNCWGSLCGWYSKTNISRIPITQTDTPHVDLQAPRQARRPAPECSAKRYHPPTQTREHEADPPGAVGCPRESDTPKRGKCRGNTSQGREASMSVSKRPTAANASSWSAFWITRLETEHRSKLLTNMAFKNILRTRLALRGGALVPVPPRGPNTASHPASPY